MAGNVKLISGGSSGTTTIQTNESTDRTINLPDASATLVGKDTADALSNKTIILAAGTNSVAPLVLTSGTNLTTAAAGAIEFDGTVFYSTPVASARGVSPSKMFAMVAAGDFALATTSGVQAAFAASNDVWTLQAATTYMFEGLYLITHSTTTCTAAMAFALGGGASVTAINYAVWASILAANTTSTASNFTWVSQVASTVVSATSTVGWAISFLGMIQMNVGGTVTPQINWSANTTAPVMKANSFISFTPLGTNTVTAVGNVG